MYISFVIITFSKNNSYIYIYICILKCDCIICGLVPSYAMPSKAPCDSELSWLLLCGW